MVCLTAPVINNSDVQGVVRVVWSGEDAEGRPQQRLQTVSPGEQYVKGGIGCVCRGSLVELTRRQGLDTNNRPRINVYST
eukprot:3580883-Pyramimonas_sp.AAC.1